MEPSGKPPFSRKIIELFNANGWKNSQLQPAVSSSTIQKMRTRNYQPEREQTVGKMAVALKKQGCPVEYEELIGLWRQWRQAARNSTVKASELHKPKAPTNNPVPAISRQLLNDISHLHTTDEIRESVIRVLSHADYPCWMAVSGKLVRNPVWVQIPEERRVELTRKHQLAGDSLPTIMHLDMLLIRRNDSRGRGELYTYFSRDWGVNMLRFRQRLPDEEPSGRSALNNHKMAKHCDGVVSSVSVTPMPGKFAVSVKPHPKYGDLIIYVYEFCSVVFASKPEFLRESDKPTGLEDNNRLWCDLDSLRSNSASWALNGDVIRAIHELFTVSLGPVPVSFVEQPTTKKRKEGTRN